MRTREVNIHGNILSGMEFSLNLSGHGFLDHSWSIPESFCPFNRLYMVKSGSAFLWSGGKEYRMEPGMAYLLPAGLPCANHCPDQMEKLFFHFNYLRMDRYDIFWGADRIYCLPIPEGLWDRMSAALESSSLESMLIIQQGVLTMATSFLCESGLGRDSVSGYSRLVTDTIAYIRDNLSSQLRLDNLASISFVSKSQLRNKFRSETGITLGRYIDEQLILEAQRRLCQTEDTISKISFDLGFCDQFYFSNRFSRRCGIAPQVYRKRTRQLIADHPEPLSR